MTLVGGYEALGGVGGLLGREITRTQRAFTACGRIYKEESFCCLRATERRRSARSLSIVLQVGLLLRLNLSDPFHKVLVLDLQASAAQRAHAGLHTNSLQLCTVEIIR